MWQPFNNSVRALLFLGSLALFLALLILNTTNLLPLGVGDFSFFAALFFSFALYRPIWAWVVLVAMLPLEIVNLAPPEFGLTVRPYQFLGGIIFVALGIRLLSGRLPTPLPEWHTLDSLWIIFLASSFLSGLLGIDPHVGLKQAVIVASFLALYFVARYFLRTPQHLKRILPFVIGPGILVTLYALWQNIRFARGLESFEVMPTRPNGTFAEADWLGMYLVLMISIVYALLYYLSRPERLPSLKFSIFNFQFFRQRWISLWLTNNVQFFNFQILKQAGLWGMLVLFYIILIITVARSAWLGVAVATGMFLLLVLMNEGTSFKQWRWKSLFTYGGGIIVSVMLALGLVSVFDLTTFQLGNRTQSTASGLQRITVSCGQEIALPAIVPDIQTLAAYNCRHINLEDMNHEKAAGYFVTTVLRPDPNVEIRRDIYKKVGETLATHPILGIGWGNIGPILGTDERGASLNASNVFLEVWLGSGLVGLLIFLWMGGWILWQSVRLVVTGETLGIRTMAAFILISAVGFTVFNLFNSGLLLGFVWVWLAVASLLLAQKEM